MLRAGKHADARSNVGFTLIELLVVIVIVGIVLSMASLSIGVLGRDNEIEDQARRLQAVLTQVREESELQGRDVGLLVEKEGYFFMRYDYATQHWQQMNNDELTAYRKLPDGLQFQLWLEDREIVIKTHEENKELLARSASSSSSSSISASVGNEKFSEYQISTTTKTNTALKEDVVPQIMLLSSGDISPFELRLSRDQTDFSWRLVATPDNQLTLDSGSNLQ